MTKTNKRIIGITGGVGSGKTTVLRILKEEYGAKVLVADEIGHEVFDPGNKVYPEIISRFGEKIDRGTLAKIIFQDEKEKEYINSLVHPYVLDRIREEINTWESNNKDPKGIIVIETALMFESGCDKMCDEVWGILTEKRIRIQRLMDTRGYTKEHAEAIIHSQIPDEEYRKYCDQIVENNGTPEELSEKIRQVIEDAWKVCHSDGDTCQEPVTKGNR